MAIDRFGRDIHYLRISLTDRCNLRCVYCMPETVSYRPKATLMRDDELLALMPLFSALGFHKYRLTGGEPTVRAHIVDVVRGIARTPGVRSLSMTTNGVLLEQLAEPLKAAGLQRVNISIDTLNDARFKRITRRGLLADVWAGVAAAERAGLTPIKLNAVVVRGYNEDDVADLASLTLAHAWQVRFIEMMPFGEVAGFQQGQLVSFAEMRRRIETRFGTLEPVAAGHLDGEARLFRLAGARGEIGFINSVSQPFCASCTRARLTADGRLRMCLLQDDEVDLLTPLRAGATSADLKTLISQAIWNKPWGHDLAADNIPLNRVMGEIGG